MAMFDIDDILARNFTSITDNYAKFARDKSQCKKCSVFDAYKQITQSEGNAKNPIFMIIGESAGNDEVAQVRPFIGKAGQRLRQELRKYKDVFNRNTTIITNVLPCRPRNNVFPRDSDGPYTLHDGPHDGHLVKARDLVSFCATNWLYREINLLQPKIIITLGSKALGCVRGDTGITSNRGSWKFINSFRAWSFATYHPSYVLRCENSEDKFYIVEDFESDIKKIAETWSSIVLDDERLNMPMKEWKKSLLMSRHDRIL
jgi:DNA polymerase